MKTYVITISERFPKTHKKFQYLTGFEHKIEEKIKIHTIRGNYPLWKKRFEEIEKGNACLSVRGWLGKPYRSKQYEFFRFFKEDGIGVECLNIYKDGNDRRCWVGEEVEENLKQTSTCYGVLAANDGLSENDFIDWFKDYDLSQPMAIIHFTKFRYND